MTLKKKEPKYIRGGCELMNKKYFLTALFQNKYGTALKYYDETGWHWMLPGDKPILFESEEEARPVAEKLEIDVIARVNINAIKIYQNIYETRITIEEYNKMKEKIPNTDLIHEKIEGKYGYFLTVNPYHITAKYVDGLYPIDKKEEIWIYGKIMNKTETFDPDIHANECYHKLEEAKAKMTMFDNEKSEIQKLEGVLLFVRKIIKNPRSSNNEFDVEKSPEKLIDEAYQALECAKIKMNANGYDKNEIAKFESVALFVSKIRKHKGLSKV